ncbi:hypothetical protein [Sebaldella sp. S0638]|uniref:hypothetical protein n=1 Tax=Sebaldella sp. S0638 TaxID=2957809 RepID=UPI00209FA545|nr:hypothetical protein [Sebaldella sp. S0638]MCP1226783.1 hypothetical protein [Sebaldella sp. S0638]
MSKERAEKLCWLTDEVLALLEEHEITEYEFREIILGNMSNAYKHSAILKKGIYTKKG